MPLACDLEESLTELFAIAATGLDGAAVGVIQRTLADGLVIVLPVCAAMPVSARPTSSSILT